MSAAQHLIEMAIAEDIGPGDATSEVALDADTTPIGCIIAKTFGVIADPHDTEGPPLTH